MLALLKKYQDWVLVFCALCFVGLIAYLYFWGVGFLVVTMNGITSPGGNGRVNVDFHIDEAQRALQSRGINPQ